MKTKPTKPKMNVRLLRKIQKQILKEPRQFHMSWWFRDAITSSRKIPNCGTAACIGGWAVAIANKQKPNITYKEVGSMAGAVATKLLGLSMHDSSRLFGFYNWPYKLQRISEEKEGTPAFARQAVRRIDHFIKTGE